MEKAYNKQICRDCRSGTGETKMKTYRLLLYRPAVERQLLYHLLSVAPEYATPDLIKEANKFHRIPEVPKLKGSEE